MLHRELVTSRLVIKITKKFNSVSNISMKNLRSHMNYFREYLENASQLIIYSDGDSSQKEINVDIK